MWIYIYIKEIKLVTSFLYDDTLPKCPAELHPGGFPGR